MPLLLLQALQSEGQSLTTLLHLGVRFLEEDEAGYIIQQGGWVSFKHAVEENAYTSIFHCYTTAYLGHKVNLWSWGGGRVFDWNDATTTPCPLIGLTKTYYFLYIYYYLY